jgi:UDP-N-acetylglucosamine--N-acetylmuramyl-(pentapeptide) pyrophosphoryl-undecaprenol N-acetylglucosamine transferase
MSTPQHIKVMIAGGGTGGHVFPAIAIADAIRALAPDAQFLFVGANGKMEMERVPKAGYRIEGLDIAGIHRPLNLHNLLRNLRFPWLLYTSMRKARALVDQFKPDVVVGTGGYASGPVVRAAQRSGIPTLIQEQNSYAGLTNKWLGKAAKAICVAYDGMQAFFPASQIRLTGNPVRQDLLYLSSLREEGLRHFGLQPGKRTMVVLGGSLGARTLNQTMAAGQQLLASRPDVQVVWQCGRLNETTSLVSDTAALPHVRVHTFIDRMDLLYAAADLIVSRAGALTISELTLVGKPAILVPSPNVAEDHQTHNAMALVQQGAALMVRDADAPHELLTKAYALLDSPSEKSRLAQGISAVARPNAALDIARMTLELARQGALAPESATDKTTTA